MKSFLRLPLERVLHELKEFWYLLRQSAIDFQRVSKIDTSWFVVWMVIYSGFILLDIFMPGFWGSTLLKYTGIFLCVVYAHRKFPTDVLLSVALLLTFCSDTILVWTPFEWLGVFVFCFAQFRHTIRLTKASWKTIALYAGGLISAYIVARLRGIDALYAIAGFYAITLVMNVAIAIRNYRKDKKDFRTRCAFYGFLCFLGCDLCVGIRHLILDGLIDVALLPLVGFLVWVFYYPSQVILANSSNAPMVDTSHKGRKIAKSRSVE